MNAAKVMEVLRQVEWLRGGAGITESYCPSCHRAESVGHADDCKLAVLLSEGEKDEELTYPILICSVCKKLDGICKCKPKPIRWWILQPEYYQSVLRTCGRG